MFYAIDYDTRKVESKNENDNLLQKYILNNNLELSVALISSEEELVLKFSLNEMQDLYDSLNIDSWEITFETEDQAAANCWDLLEKSTIPKFTKKLGTQLLKRYPKNERPSPKKKKAAKQTKLTLQTIFKGFTNQ